MPRAGAHTPIPVCRSETRAPGPAFTRRPARPPRSCRSRRSGQAGNPGTAPVYEAGYRPFTRPAGPWPAPTGRAHREQPRRPAADPARPGPGLPAARPGPDPGHPPAEGPDRRQRGRTRQEPASRAARLPAPRSRGVGIPGTRPLPQRVGPVEPRQPRRPRARRIPRLHVRRALPRLGHGNPVHLLGTGEPYPVSWNLPTQPGTEGLKLASFAQLKTIARSTRVARRCIELRKEEICGLEWEIEMTTHAAKAYQGDHKADAGLRGAGRLGHEVLQAPGPGLLELRLVPQGAAWRKSSSSTP